MAHFAELDRNNIVLQVIVVNNAEMLDENGIEQEDIGRAFCKNILGGTWKQTSYNSKIRKNYAGIGYTYDAVNDAFIAPKPYSGWVLNTETFQWDAPIPYPSDGKMYIWDDVSQSWAEEGKS